MTMLAQAVHISRVENGWLLNVYNAGTNLVLVAREIGEVVGFLKGMEWQTPRPLPEFEKDSPPDTVPTTLTGTVYSR